MKQVVLTILFGLALAACGGAPPPDEEVPAAWTSGDDEPLETPEATAE
jgi:hypothetical protein